MKETFVSESPVKVEVISSKFLQKTPTSNLTEAMDIVNGIQPALIDRIEIIKGPASTLYDTEAVADVINVITKSPKKPVFSINTFATSHLEKTIDATYVPILGKHRTFLSGNYFGMSKFLDFNKDGFSDVPLVQRFSLANSGASTEKITVYLICLAGISMKTVLADSASGAVNSEGAIRFMENPFLQAA